MPTFPAWITLHTVTKQRGKIKAFIFANWNEFHTRKYIKVTHEVVNVSNISNFIFPMKNKLQFIYRFLKRPDVSPGNFQVLLKYISLFKKIKLGIRIRLCEASLNLRLTMAQWGTLPAVYITKVLTVQLFLWWYRGVIVYPVKNRPFLASIIKHFHKRYRTYGKASSYQRILHIGERISCDALWSELQYNPFSFKREQIPALLLRQKLD